MDSQLGQDENSEDQQSMVDESMGINEDSMMAPTPTEKKKNAEESKGTKKGDTKGRGRKTKNKNHDPSD